MESALRRLQGACGVLGTISPGEAHATRKLDGGEANRGSSLRRGPSLGCSSSPEDSSSTRRGTDRDGGDDLDRDGGDDLALGLDRELGVGLG